MYPRSVARSTALNVLGLLNVAVLAATLFALGCGGNGGGLSSGVIDGSVDYDGTTGFHLGGNEGGSQTKSSCASKTCASLGYTCGQNSDGCGNLIDCGSCTAPNQCGVGGFSQCGNPTVGPDGGTLSCVSKTCQDLGFTCGQNSDGCGNIIDCGTCSTGYCGGGGFSQCGTGPDAGADAAPPCTATTCATLGNTCGAQGDGCGGLVGPCGTGACTLPQICGGGGVFNQCGGAYNDAGAAVGADGGVITPPSCTPITCATLAAQGIANTCGQQGNGCGGLVGPCGTQTTCTAPAYCGGGGFNQCGTGQPVGGDGGVTNGCIPTTCATLAARGIANTCGPQSDGCGGLVGPCGTQTTCVSPAFCGGGGFNQCGGDDRLGPDGGITCAPLTCANYADAGYNCGQASDGCGSLTASCGSCAAPAYCGGGGGYKCGGNVGADGGTISQCVPATCASKGYNCGSAGDGCGGVIDGGCGSCTGVATCGGGGVANVCGSTATCTGLCADVPTCDSGTTTITGVVRAGIQVSLADGGVSLDGGGAIQYNGGATPDPVPGVLVYIPQTALSAFGSPTAPQVTCASCSADVSGDPLVSTTTNYEGAFTLTNTPVGTTVPIVIQLGRWRREFTFTVPASAACGSTNVGTLNMPSTSSEGDIPLTAISTGNLDPIECVLLKMGVAQSEFVDYETWTGRSSPDGGAPRPGRIHIYTAQENGTTAANEGTGETPEPGAHLGAPYHQLDETCLMGGTCNVGTSGTPTYDMYDQILLPCWGGPAAKSATAMTNLATYGGNGGRFFATHFSYSWLFGNTNGNLGSIANWDLGADTNADNCGGGFGEPACAVPGNAIDGVFFYGDVSDTVPPTVPVTNPGVFSEWLGYVGALYSGTAAGDNAVVQITAGRHDVDSPANGSVSWISGTDPNTPQKGIDAPGGGTVSTASTAMDLHFTFNMPVPTTTNPSPTECGHGIFSDFHVVASSTTPNGTAFPGECDTNAMNSQERIIEYMIWDLSSCVQPTTSTCASKNCEQQGFTCGPASDSCGNLIDGGCGTCSNGQLCGGGGVSSVCGLPDGGACTTVSCTTQGFNCGMAGDGCGGTQNCGSCPAGETCGGGGQAGVCGKPDACVPLTCQQQSIVCGAAGNGCGGTITSCGNCPSGTDCINGQCITPEAGTCTPMTCQDQNLNCGQAGDGCGNIIQSCGTCPSGQACGVGGTPGQCAPVPDASAPGCAPQSCQDQGIQCGPAGDGCGNVITSCGTCTAPQICGGCGMPGVCCGTSSCVPQSCDAQNIACGPAGDGCGNLLQCGECDGGTCGGGGVNGQCGGGSTCMPATCAQQGISCGPAGDGCGGTIPSCGSCTAPQTCGGAGINGVCGAPTTTAQ